ncbi:MAG TPA: hypothetical protein VFX15_05030 [Actinomycetes bacterium]|nr:hypothetical protein [Actinomycetes bacterium]
MNRTDQQVRAAIDTLARMAPAPHDLAASAMERARRRRNRETVWGTAAACVLVVAVALGVVQVDRTDEGTPADNAPTSPAPSPTPSATEESSETSLSPGAIALLKVSEDRRTKAPHCLRRFTAAHNFSVSPNGQQLAFASGVHVYLCNAQGNNLQRVGGSWIDPAPSWSPNSQQLVISNGRRIVIVDLASRTQQVVVVEPNPVYRPTFSPDGQSLLFTENTGKDSPFALWTVPVWGGTPQMLLNRSAFGVYSPDGSSIAFRRTDFPGSDMFEMTNARVFVAEPDGSHPHAFGINDGSMSQIDEERLWPSWSPDGRRIAFQPLLARPVHVLDVQTGETKILSGDWKDPVWLDNDTLIVSSGSS